MSQAFDRVWRLLFKIKSARPARIYGVLKPFLQDRHFLFHIDEALSELQPTKSGVPPGSGLGLILYLIYTSDLPIPASATIGIFADSTAIM